MANLDAEQRKNAAVIAKVGAQMGASKRDIQIAIATALTESSLRNVTHGDSAGPDSTGLFQQRNGWGSRSTRQDPAGSSKLFYQALFKVKNRDKIQPWQAAQAVQRSAYSDGRNYRANWSLAQSAAGSAGYGGSVSSVVSSASSSGGYEMAPPLSAQELAENYGFAMSFLKQHKDVYSKFSAAVQHNWTPEHFVAELKNTGWWKKNANAVRQYQVLKANDPATLNARRQALTAQIRDSAATLGASMSMKQVSKVAENALMFQWNDSQLRDTLAGYTKAVNGVYNGQAGTDTDALKQTAWRNGIHVSSVQVQNWAQQIAKGNASVNFYQDYIRKQARAVAPSFANELDSGMDLYDIAQPYIQAKAKLLQLNPADIDLFDNDVRGALSAKDQTGKPTSKSLWQFENDMRQDSRYLKTDTAKDQAYGIGHKVLQDMGFMGQGS
jgi:hypothetical protein